jgi:hypothetical protein
MPILNLTTLHRLSICCALLLATACGGPKKVMQPPRTLSSTLKLSSRSLAKQQGTIASKALKKHTSGVGKVRKRQERALKHQRRLQKRKLRE